MTKRNRTKPQATDHPIRYSAEPRVAVVESTKSNGKRSPNLTGFSTISAHLYRGTYYAGSLPRDDAPTTGVVSLVDDETLRFELSMKEPDMAKPRATVPVRSDDDPFWRDDFVSLNFIDDDNVVLQVAARMDGAKRILKAGRTVRSTGVTTSIVREARSWRVEISIQSNFFGRKTLDLDNRPIPFDVVRLRAASAALTSWCPIPDGLPFNEMYSFPVFHFGLLSAKKLPWLRFAGKAPGIGTTRLKGISKVQAGTFTRFELVHTVGTAGLAVGGAVKFNLANEVIECARRSTVKHPMPEKDWTPLQWDEPLAPGHVTVSCSRTGAKLRFEKNDVFSTTVRLAEGPALEQGDAIIIGVGTAKGCPGVRSQLLTQNNYPVKVFVDPVGNGVFFHPDRFPTIDVVGRPARRFLLHCQPTPDAGERFRLVVVAVDDLGNIANSFQGDVAFYCQTKVKGLPAKGTFSKKDGGVKCWKIAIPAKGACTIQAVAVKDAAVNGESELIVTDGAFGPGKIYFGDIHTHSQLSDGRLHPFDKHREVALHRGCDFWALTDHGHDLTPKRVALLNETMRKFNKPGDFVTLPAYEWTGSMGQGHPKVRQKQGHRNVYFDGPVKEILDGVDPRGDTPRKLKKALRDSGQDAVIINHFHCGEPDMVSGVDDGVEVSGWCSMHNREYGKDSPLRSQYSLEDVFDQGYKVGVTAGSDHGTEAYYTGLSAELTAVKAEKLERSDVFRALREGRTYATSGQRTLIQFSVNGVEPSRSARTIKAKKRRIELVVGSKMPVQKVQIIKNGDVWKDFGDFDFGVRRFVATDDEPLKSGCHYYVRVHTAQGHKTWSSPIYAGKPPFNKDSNHV